MDAIKGTLSESAKWTCAIKSVNYISGCVSAESNYTGKLSSIQNTSGKLSSIQTILGTLSCAGSVKCTLKEVTNEEYEGEYQVEPSSENTVLNTKGKYVAHDITVLPIGYYETSNDSGYTVYIGKG